MILEFKYNSVAAAALRSSTNKLLPVRYIDTKLNEQFAGALDLKENQCMLLNKRYLHLLLM